MLNKDKIRHSFWGQYLISCLHIAECKIMPKLVDDETAVKRFFKKKAGYELDLSDPQTFSEKMNWYKLNVRNSLMPECADKIAVREYVKKCGLEHLLNEMYAVYNSVDDIDPDILPDQFVIKAAHGSHMNLIVPDKSRVEWKKQKLLMSTWLKQDIYWSGREWVYKDLPKRLFAERFISDEDGELKDYKFFCFNGEPAYLEFDVGRYNGKHYRNYYDMDMSFVPISDSCPNDKNINLPFEKSVFDEMKQIVKTLAEPFQFVRVDLYYVNGKIYFGELTFFDGGGFQFFNEKEYDTKFSEKWKIRNE